MCIRDSTYIYKQSQVAVKYLRDLMGKRAFSNPKDYEVIARIIRYCTSPGDVVLDSFAGSGTTAHAILALNKEDGGDRRFVLIECEDYVDELTAERVRRVIKGVPKAKNETLRTGLGGTFSSVSYTHLDVYKRQEFERAVLDIEKCTLTANREGDFDEDCL